MTVHAGPVALLFPPGRHQRLSHIRVGDLGGTTLTYEGTVLASPSNPLTRAGVAFALGPTYGDGAEQLAYPGVYFEVDSAGGRDDRVSSVSVIPRDDVPNDGLRQCSIHVSRRLVHFSPQPGKGVTLDFGRQVDIVLGETTAQDLLLDVGTPLRKYWKEDDRLDRVWGQQSAPAVGEDSSLPISVFWNYFQYGLDFLIVDDIVTKAIIYSNIVRQELQMLTTAGNTSLSAIRTLPMGTGEQWGRTGSHQSSDFIPLAAVANETRSTVADVQKEEEG